MVAEIVAYASCDNGSANRVIEGGKRTLSSAGVGHRGHSATHSAPQTKLYNSRRRKRNAQEEFNNELF